MKTLAVYDRADYDASLPRDIRHSARAIIRLGSKIALIYSPKYEMYIFPGGKIEDGETHENAVSRETREETGLIVKPGSVRPFGMITEIRKDIKVEGIFEQHDHFYTCDVEEDIVDQTLSRGELESGYQLALVSLDEAILANELEIQTGRKFSERETFILKLLRNAEVAE